MITLLGEARVNLSVFHTFVRFVLVWICRFPLPLGVLGTELTIFGQLKILMMFSINLNLKTFRLLNCLYMIFLHCILRDLIIL